MLTTIITAVVTGAGTLLFNWLAQRKARADAAKAATLEALTQGQAQKHAAEVAIQKAVDDARAKPIDPLNWSADPVPPVPDGVRLDAGTGP